MQLAANALISAPGASLLSDDAGGLVVIAGRGVKRCLGFTRHAVIVFLTLVADRARPGWSGR